MISVWYPEKQAFSYRLTSLWQGLLQRGFGNNTMQGYIPKIYWLFQKK